MKTSKNKIIIAFLLLTVFFVAAMPITMLVNASSKKTMVWDGNTVSTFSNGNGSASNPYCISNAFELAYLAKVVNDNIHDSTNGGYYNSATKHYRLTKDIYLNDVNSPNWIMHSPNSWESIGNSNATAFKGIFDGGGYVVRGIYINQFGMTGNNQGLFGHLEGGICNLGLEQGYIGGNNNVGSIAGKIKAWGRIINCYNTCIVEGVDQVGGIVGVGDSGFVIANTYNAGQIIGEYACGGIIAGFVESTSILNCFYLNTSLLGGSANGTPFYSNGDLLTGGKLLDSLTEWVNNNISGIYRVWLNGEPFPIFEPMSGFVVEFETEEVPNGIINTYYETQITAGSNMGVDVKYKIIKGAIPLGLIFDECTGMLTGTPQAFGNFQFTILATDKDRGANSQKQFTFSILKATKESAPLKIAKRTSTSITVGEVLGAEYKIGNGQWQDSNIFSNLKPSTSYLLSIRYKETSTAYASEILSGMFITLANISPIVKNSNIILARDFFEDYSLGEDLPIPKKAGFKFEAWQHNGNPITKIDYLEKDIELNAVWSLEKPIIAIGVDNNSNGERVLSCNVVKYPDIAYQYEWYEQSGDSFAKIVGQNTALLELENIENDTNYKCIVTATSHTLMAQSQSTANVSAANTDAPSYTWLWVILGLAFAMVVTFILCLIFVNRKKDNGEIKEIKIDR